MPVLNDIATRCGTATLERIEKVADDEVGLAKLMPLVDEVRQQVWYRRRELAGELLQQFEQFERAGLRYTPTDLVDVIFECKLLVACDSHDEFHQRRGGWPMYPAHGDRPQWRDKGQTIDQLIDRYTERISDNIQERTLVTTINSFKTTHNDHGPISHFFEELFGELRLPFTCYFEGDGLVDQHRRWENFLPTYDRASAATFFSAPSIGFTSAGTRDYCLWVSSAWLQTFFHMFRIAAFLNPGQRDFGFGAQMTAPKFPVFLGDHAAGAFSWREDTRESWAKIPDGSLFRSFGFRGISFTWLDHRTFPGIRLFIIQNRKVLESLHNPWHAKRVNDTAPVLDLLSSAIQIPDVGTKVLLIYCCLEHMFVPVNASTENKKYIIGGLNALSPALIPWFENFHRLRCTYAHEGFLLGGVQTLTVITEAMRNVMQLLVARVSIP